MILLEIIVAITFIYTFIYTLTSCNSINSQICMIKSTVQNLAATKYSKPTVRDSKRFHQHTLITETNQITSLIDYIIY